MQSAVLQNEFRLPGETIAELLNTIAPQMVSDIRATLPAQGGRTVHGSLHGAFQKLKFLTTGPLTTGYLDALPAGRSHPIHREVYLRGTRRVAAVRPTLALAATGNRCIQAGRAI